MTLKSASTGPFRPFSLRRWSQRKLEAARAEAQGPPPPTAAAPVPLAAQTSQDALQPPDPAQPADAPLPPIESLTIDSDFAPFFKPQVDESIKRAALKQLFRDPRFNIMDGLDTYIDDYTQPDPIPPAMLEGLMERRVSFLLPEPEVDVDVRTVDEGAGDRAASSADAIAPQVPEIEPIAPVVPGDAAPDPARDTADAMRDTRVDLKVGEP
jgi:Protein of unknown function (DUF3306)